MGYTIQKRWKRCPRWLLGLTNHLLGLIVHTNHTIRAVKLATSVSFSRLCSCASSSYIVLLAGGGTKFDVEAASAITDTVLGINSSDTLLGDGSGVISGEITGVEASEKPDEGIIRNSSSAKIFREKNGFGDQREEVGFREKVPLVPVVGKAAEIERAVLP